MVVNNYLTIKVFYYQRKVLLLLHNQKQLFMDTSKTGYEKWLMQELTNLGSFATSLMETYMRADSNNRAKLEQAFPEWFVKRS
jgi:hypothetical protein